MIANRLLNVLVRYQVIDFLMCVCFLWLSGYHRCLTARRSLVWVPTEPGVLSSWSFRQYAYVL